MHSTIFQISANEIEGYNFLNENTLEQGEGGTIDYCQKVGYDQRRKLLDDLVEYVLPKGMFTVVDENTIRYNGGVEDWYQTWVDDLNKAMAKVNAKNIAGGTGEEIKRIFDNPLDTSMLFYIGNELDCSETSESGELMRDLRDLEPNTLLHIGGILDYHF